MCLWVTSKSIDITAKLLNENQTRLSCQKVSSIKIKFYSKTHNICHLNGHWINHKFTINSGPYRTINTIFEIKVNITILGPAWSNLRAQKWYICDYSGPRTLSCHWFVLFKNWRKVLSKRIRMHCTSIATTWIHNINICSYKWVRGLKVYLLINIYFVITTLNNTKLCSSINQ